MAAFHLIIYGRFWVITEDYRGKYLILLVNSRHIRGGGYCLARVAAEAPTLRQIALKHYAK
jgi:hypothetical protein